MSNRRTDLFLRFFISFFYCFIFQLMSNPAYLLTLQNVNLINLFGFKLDELGTLFPIFSDGSHYIFIFINMLRLLF